MVIENFLSNRHSRRFFLLEQLKGLDIMLNSERLIMEIGITIPPEQVTVYLAEEGLTDTDEYDPTSNINKRKIYSAALSVLNSIANNPNNMKAYKQDDISVNDFAESIQNRIDQLERKIRMMAVSDSESSQTNTFMLFNS